MAKRQHGGPAASTAAQPTPRAFLPRGKTPIWVAVTVVLVALIGTGTYQAQTRPDASAPADGAAGLTVRDNSHRLSVAPDAKVTLVEFVDFECEACGQGYPAVQQLRADYGDRVTFMVRYFPQEGHVNAQRAARAVEAAAQQGRFDAMYTKMFQTQAQWSGQQEPKDDEFRSYAQELGLDMDRWEAAYASDATWARIQADIDDGLALDVTSTPGFFLNGDKIKPQSVEDLTEALDEALAR